MKAIRFLVIALASYLPALGQYERAPRSPFYAADAKPASEYCQYTMYPSYPPYWGKLGGETMMFDPIPVGTTVQGTIEISLEQGSADQCVRYWALDFTPKVPFYAPDVQLIQYGGWVAFRVQFTPTSTGNFVSGIGYSGPENGSAGSSAVSLTLMGTAIDSAHSAAPVPDAISEKTLRLQYATASDGFVEVLFYVPRPGHVRLVLYDAGGRFVNSYSEPFAEVGSHRAAMGILGKPSGLYRVQVDDDYTSVGSWVPVRH